MPNNNNQNGNNDNRSKTPLIVLAVVVIVFTIFGNRIMSMLFAAGQEEVTYHDFLSSVENNEIENVKIGETQIFYEKKLALLQK